MGQESANVECLKEAYRLWDESKGGSADHWMAVCDDHVDFRSLADGADKLEFTKRRTSREDLVGYFEGLTGQMEMIHYTVDEFVAQGDRVVAIGSTAWRNRATGKEFETPKVDLWRFDNGRAVEFFEFFDTAMAAAVMSD